MLESNSVLHVKNWSKFQHYKERRPPWIKLATDTFQNYEFSRLQDASKLLAICIWTLASRSEDGSCPDDFAYIKQQSCLGNSVNESHLKELIDNGFINRASNPLASCKQSAMPEAEAETETEGRSDGRVRMISLPDWLPDADWIAYLESRKQKPTPASQKLLIEQLESFGDDKLKVLKRTTMYGWTSFHALNERGNGKTSREGKHEKAVRAAREAIG